MTCTWLSDLLNCLRTADNPSFNSVQFAGAVGVANCNGGPQLQFMAGRANSSEPAPSGLIPGPADSVDKILARMADAGFSADELVDLMASHSVAAQKNLDRVRVSLKAYYYHESDLTLVHNRTDHCRIPSRLNTIRF